MAKPSVLPRVFGAPGGRALPPTVCLATVRFAGPALAPGALRTAELSPPVAPLAPECCLALAAVIAASPHRPKSSFDIA